MAAWAKRVRRQTSTAHELLKRAVGSADLSDETRKDIKDVLGRWSRINGLIERALPKRLDVTKTRHHGDLHLAQVVVVRDDFYILDFEGEPTRSMEERRSKHSPLRDVAGMIRSFNYAAFMSPFDHQPLRPGAVGELQSAIDQWETLAVQSFLEGYQNTIQNYSSVPKESKHFKHLLEFFVLEKALYEICYEAANRPDWLYIPVKGVQQLLASNA